MDSDAQSSDHAPPPNADEQASGDEPEAVPGAVPATDRPTRLAAVLTDRLARWSGVPAERGATLSATLVAGLLLWASFPVLNWWCAAVAAFALLGWVLIRPATTLAGGLGYGFLFGLAFYLPLLTWTGDFVGVWPWLALAVLCALYPGLFGVLAVVVRGVPGWPIWFAALWGAQEWAKSAFPFGGFPWGTVGFGQTTGPLLPLAALGGVPLLSVAIVLLGCTTTAITIAIGRCLPGGGTGTHRRRAAISAVLLPGICVCLVCLATAIATPQIQGVGAESGSGTEAPVMVAAVQGSVPRLGYDFNAQRRQVLDYHLQETLRLADDVAAGRAQQPQLVIWPENASDIDPLTNADAAHQIATAAAAIHAPILVGAVRAGPGATDEHPAWLNSVMVFDPQSGWGERHDKAIIQPFGEYLPWPAVFRHLSSYAERVSHFVAGQGPGVVHAAGVPVGVATCWEVIFDRAPRRSVLAGAQLLAVPTNNATFDETMSRQQLAIAKTRAVEHDRYVVVAGTSGISAVIAPNGHELAHTDFNQPAYLDSPVRLETRLTPATRWGPVVQRLLVGAAVVAGLAALLQNRWWSTCRNRRHQTPG
ncbi:apolipoprotein N-acyltransferase [Mycobacterium sp.]|uniref:apolipoprotein N-acyltransferase n=1 Tax=Mycobacterium sp. TaxID=1785 RepID=UPI0031D2C642